MPLTAQGCRRRAGRYRRSETELVRRAVALMTVGTWPQVSTVRPCPRPPTSCPRLAPARRRPCGAVQPFLASRGFRRPVRGGSDVQTSRRWLHEEVPATRSPSAFSSRHPKLCYQLTDRLRGGRARPAGSAAAAGRLSQRDGCLGRLVRGRDPGRRRRIEGIWQAPYQSREGRVGCRSGSVCSRRLVRVRQLDAIVGFHLTR